MCCLGMMAQTDRQHIRQGNRLSRRQKFDKAEVDYRKAADKNQKSPQALYNLGCALMAQQKDSAAIEMFQAAGFCVVKSGCFSFGLFDVFTVTV